MIKRSISRCTRCTLFSFYFSFHFTSFRLNISSCLFLVLLVNSHTSVLRSRNVSNGLVVIGYSLCGAHFHYADRTRLPFLQIAHSQTHAHSRGGIWNGWQFVHIECNAQQCVEKERKMNEWWNKKKSIYNKWANEWMNKKSAWTWRQSFIESFFLLRVFVSIQFAGLRFSTILPILPLTVCKWVCCMLQVLLRVCLRINSDKIQLNRCISSV